MTNELSDTEKDIQIAGTRLFDYLFDLFLVASRNDSIVVNELVNIRLAIRIQFGDAVVRLVRAIKEDINE